jgi:hypothetical protein
LKSSICTKLRNNIFEFLALFSLTTASGYSPQLGPQEAPKKIMLLTLYPVTLGEALFKTTKPAKVQIGNVFYEAPKSETHCT